MTAAATPGGAADGARLDVWGVPTPQAVRSGLGRARVIDERVFEVFGRADTPDEGWEALAVAGLIPARWVGDPARAFANERESLLYDRPRTTGLATALAAHPRHVEDVEDAARAIVAALPAWASRGDGWTVAWTARPGGWQFDGLATSAAVIEACEAAAQGAPTGEWDEARHRARAGIARVGGLDAALSERHGGGLLNKIYTLAHLGVVRSAAGCAGPNPALALLDVWERGFLFHGVNLYVLPGGDRVPRLALSTGLHRVESEAREFARAFAVLNGGRA